jgi:hypothetical protein
MRIKALGNYPNPREKLFHQKLLHLVPILPMFHICADLSNFAPVAIL